MKIFRADYKKIVWGSALIYAETKEEAQKRLDEGDVDDEEDNKSDYEWEKVYEDD